MKYWVLKARTPDDGVRLSIVPSAGPEGWQYHEGVSLADGYPQRGDASMYFDPDYPEDVVLYDFVDNINGLVVASQKAQTVFGKLGVSNIEVLPVWLCDHQDEVASREYAILNVLGSVDCIDMDRSIVRMDSIIKNQISGIKKIYLKHDSIQQDAKIFRASTRLNEIFVRDDVKKSLESAGLVGCKFFEADGWNGFCF